MGQSSIHFENEDSLLYFKNVGGNVAFDNQLLGNGTVRADGSAVLVDADNSAFTGTWEIGTGNAYDMAGQKLETAAGASTLRFEKLSALGGTAEDGYADFAIGAGSTLELGIQSSYELMHETTGEGGVTIDAGADENGSLNVVTLNSTFAHTGLTHVVSGGIRSAGDETASDVSDAAEGSAASDETADNVEAASAQAEEGLEESAGNAESPAARRTTIQGDLTLDAGTFMEGFAGVKGTVTNAGTIYVNWKRYADEALGESPSTVYDEATANTLHIAGDYVGQDGMLVFNGALAGDDSPVDTIEIAGNASGTGKVQVHNLGGKGDLTSPYGITLVTVEGDSTLSLSQDGRIVAGAYDYVLLRDPDSRRFYLQSTADLARGADRSACASGGWCLHVCRHGIEFGRNASARPRRRIALRRSAFGRSEGNEHVAAPDGVAHAFPQRRRNASHAHDGRRDADRRRHHPPLGRWRPARESRPLRFGALCKELNAQHALEPFGGYEHGRVFGWALCNAVQRSGQAP